MAPLGEPVAERVVAPLAIALATLLAYAIAFGLISIVTAFLRAFFHFTEDVTGFLIGWVPGVGKWVHSKIEAAEQKATNALGAAAVDLEGHVGDAFHALAGTVHSIGHEIYGLSVAVWDLAWYMHAVVKPWVIHNTLGGMARSERTHTARTRTNTRDLHNLTRALRGLAAALAGVNLGAFLKGLRAHQHGTQTQIQALQGGYAHPGAIALPRDSAGLRARTKALERGYDQLWKRVKGVDKLLGALTFAGAVTFALGRLGAGWLRCSNWNRVGRRVCRMDPRVLDDLLLGTLLVVGTLSINEFARELQGEIGLARDGIHRLIRH